MISLEEFLGKAENSFLGDGMNTDFDSIFAKNLNMGIGKLFLKFDNNKFRKNNYYEYRNNIKCVWLFRYGIT